MRIGIDVGGTHTDAVLLQDDAILASHKVMTSQDVTSGICEVLTTLLEQSPDAIRATAVMIGTTQFTNAVVQRKSLAPVAAIRIGAPSGRGLPPFVGWPADIASAIGGHTYELHGGFLYDGKPLAAFDDTALDTVIDDIASKDIQAVAITSAFSPMNASPEVHVTERLKQRLPYLNITCSHDLGRIGLLERENATLLNASLMSFADTVCSAMQSAVQTLLPGCPVFITQNDGTLMDIAFARRFPALTFASGPTNSLRGAAKLTGIQQAIVVDIGGTTSDIGVLRNSFPRESHLVVDVGGVRTNFRMPDILAIGLGGGSLVSSDGKTVGPSSVGHQLISEGLVFGGNTLTSTDIAVAAGKAHIGASTAVESLPREVITNGLTEMARLLNQGIRKMNPGKDTLPVILVGGGAFIAPDDIGDDSGVIRPQHADVANAIGAAIANIGGESERFVSYDHLPRDEAIRQVRKEACEKAIAAGADSHTLRVNEVEEVAIPYMDNGATRIRVKVVGEVALLNNVHQAQVS